MMCIFHLDIEVSPFSECEWFSLSYQNLTILMWRLKTSYILQVDMIYQKAYIYGKKIEEWGEWIWKDNKE